MDCFKESLENKRLLSQQFLSCAICIDYLDNPLRTHCLHYFCKKCLENLFRSSSNPVPCPICKFPINRRNLLECHQLQGIISVIREINASLEDDFLSLGEPIGGKLSKNPSELVIKFPVKTATSKADGGNKEVTSKLHSSSNVDKENKPILTEKMDQKGRKVSNIPIDSSEGEKIPVKKLKAPIIPQIESTISSEKVTEWLNEYCISPSNLTPQENCEPEGEISGNISKASVKDAENLPIQKSATEQTKKFFRSRDQSNIKNDGNLVQNHKDVYSFDSPNSSKKLINNTKSKKSLKSNTVASKKPQKTLNSKTVVSKKPKVIEPPFEISTDDDDDVLFQSPVRTVKALKAKNRSEKQAKLDKNKAEKKCDEPSLMNIKVNLSDCSKVNVAKDVSDSNSTRSFKRKIKSTVHSFSESQLNHHIEKVENFDSNNIPTSPIKSSRNDSIVSSKSLVKAASAQGKLPSKTTKTKSTEIDESPSGKILPASSLEIEKLRSDETKADIEFKNLQPIAKPKQKVNFYKLGKIFDSEVSKSVTCQTDDILKMNGIDVCFQVDIAPMKDVSCSPMNIEEEESNEIATKNLELSSSNIKKDTHLESPVSSNLLTSDRELHDDKISLTPSKPAKKRKTIKGLARISTDNTPSFESETISKTNVMSSFSNPTESDFIVDVVTVSSPEITNNFKSSRKLVLFSSNEGSEDITSPTSFPKVGVSSGSFSKEQNSLDIMTNKKRPKFAPENKPFQALVDSPVKNKKMKKVEVSPIKFKEAEKANNEVSTQKEKKAYRRIQTFDDSDSDEISFSEPCSTKQNLQLYGNNILGTYNIENSRENATPDSFKDEVISSTPKKGPSNVLNNNNGKCNDKINVISDSEEEEDDVTITDNRVDVEELDLRFDVFDDENEDLLYSATPLKKPQSKLEYSEELNLNDSKSLDIEKHLTESSPLTSILEDITTQNYLALKAQIKDLQLQEKQMEEELKVVEVSETSKLNSNLSVIGSVTDQSTSTRFDTSKILPHHKSINKPVETSNSESGYFGERDIVSPSPQPKQKWTPSRMVNVSRIVNETTTAVTSISNEVLQNKVPSVKSSVAPAVDKFQTMTNIDKRIVSPKNYSFTATGVDPSQMKRVKQLAQVLNGSFKPTFVPNVTTHIIVKVGPNGCCERTFKYLAGIAYGCWIVSIKWVTDSLAASCGLPEEDYEALGDNSEGAHGGPTKARLNPIPLLKGFQVLIIEPFKDLTKDQIWGLLEKCGAELASDPSKMDVTNSLKFQQLILVDKIPQNKVVDQYNELYLTRGLITVNRDWLLDSVATFTVKPIENYMMSPIDGPVSPRLY